MDWSGLDKQIKLKIMQVLTEAVKSEHKTFGIVDVTRYLKNYIYGIKFKIFTVSSERTTASKKELAQIS